MLKISKGFKKPSHQPPNEEKLVSPIDLTLKLLQLRDTPHCQAELEQDRPMSHWKTHCVNCGVYMYKPHRRGDCPTQSYEKDNQ